ncbi:hypothetical protein DPMN_024599 [Dreissena polymorpha]|uniref:Uncharacterized protein n=1 Tax=Dreissena polymorpha TaxID=45954 RepID=A0A9D4LMR2_DREPO|nr:hypothetical protein DPMN_024599 [Dreissena polymorpha]
MLLVQKSLRVCQRVCDAGLPLACCASPSTQHYQSKSAHNHNSSIMDGYEDGCKQQHLGAFLLSVHNKWDPVVSGYDNN